jgi:hypothetical protein
MIAIYGPSSRKKASTPQSGGIVLLKPDPLLVDADTLESALAAYSRQYGVRIRPYDGSNPRVPFEPGEPPKFFFYEKSDGDSWLVDIHIRRGAESICPKQDLSVSLRHSDELHIGELVC